jgi:hypothetical protein
MKESKNSYFLIMPSLIEICLLSYLVQAYGQLDSATVEPGTVSINATITEDHKNTSNPNWVYYHVKNFVIAISNRTDLCPIDRCEYSFVNENREGFRLDDSDGRMLRGLLNIISEGESKTIHVYGYFRAVDSNQEKVKEAQEGLGGTVQFYLGDKALGKEYQINGSLTWKSEKDADIALKGQL